MDCKCGLKYYLEEGRNLVESFDETGELTKVYLLALDSTRCTEYNR